MTLRITLRRFKVGGIRFLRIGRYQFAFCVCRRTTKGSVR